MKSKVIFHQKILLELPENIPKEIKISLEKQEIFLSHMKSCLDTLEKQVSWKAKTKSYRAITSASYRSFRKSQEIKNIPKLSYIKGDFQIPKRVKIYPGTKEDQFRSKFFEDLEALNRSAYGIQNEDEGNKLIISKSNISFYLKIEEDCIEGNLIIFFYPKDCAVDIAIESSNFEILKELVQAEEAKKEEDLSLLSIVKLWKRAYWYHKHNEEEMLIA